MRPPSFDGIVLAGGASRRMGVDKALIEVDGRPMVLIAVDAMVAAGAGSCAVVGRPADALGVDLAPGVECVVDDRPGEGPLGGILTGLGATTAPVVAVLPCDLPAPSPGAVAALVDALVGSDADLAVWRFEGQIQYLHLALRRSAEPALRAAFADGKRSIVGALEQLRVLEIDGQHIAPTHFRDADVPGDLPPRV